MKSKPVVAEHYISHNPWLAVCTESFVDKSIMQSEKILKQKYQDMINNCNFYNDSLHIYCTNKKYFNVSLVNLAVVTFCIPWDLALHPCPLVCFSSDRSLANQEAPR